MYIFIYVLYVFIIRKNWHNLSGNPNAIPSRIQKIFRYGNKY